MATNFNALSRKKWRDKPGDYHVELVEFLARLPGGIARKSDLFGFVDLLLIPMDPEHADAGWVFLQLTGRSNMSTRLRKIQREKTGKGQHRVMMRDLARRILESGHHILIEGWDQPGGHGTRWRDKERWLTLDDLTEEAANS